MHICGVSTGDSETARCKKIVCPMAPRPRLPLVGAPPLLLVTAVLAQLGAMSCAGQPRRLHGSVACLDCDEGHDLSGVVVAVKCAAGDDGTALLHAAQTDARGAFDVAVPASGSPCAARVLGATRRLCAPPGLTVARVVPGSASYALGSRLAFFTRCGPGDGGTAAATTMGSRDQGRAPPRMPSPRPRTPMRSPPPAGSGGSPYGMGGLPIIFFFPFVPIIGIP